MAFITCSEYYNDSETYTGASGSTTNPWAVRDVYEFCNIGTINSGNYYQLVDNIDFNKHSTYKYGIDNINGFIRAVYNVHLLGNGYDIRNLVFYSYKNDNTAFNSYFKSFTNVNFVNLICINCINHLCASGTTFENCNFSIVCSSSSTAFFCANSIMINCTLNISGSSTPTDYYKFPIVVGVGAERGTTKSGNYKQNCHFNFNDFVVYERRDSRQFCLFSGYYGSTAETKYASIINCYFTGTIYFGHSIDLEYRYMFYYVNITNCYFAIKINGITDTWINQDATVLATSFVDKELLGSTIGSLSNLYQLTTEQCKSYIDVAKIGFPVVPVTKED